MIWLTWRQFRAQAITAVAALAVFAIVASISASNLSSMYNTSGLLTCHGDACAGLASNFLQDVSSSGRSFPGLPDGANPYVILYFLSILVILIAPAITGIFWGAPLIGRELETGTHQIAWNQTVTRTRWLAVKLTIVGAASVATAGILSYLLTWWAGPLDAIQGDRWGAMTFATRDIVPLGYAAFTFALGTTLGLLLRRTLPAMAITLAVFIPIQILVPATIRPHLLPSTTVTFPVNQSIGGQVNGVEIRNDGEGIYLFGLPIPKGAWVTDNRPIEDSSGKVVSAHDHLDCFPGLDSPPGQGAGVAAKGGGPRTGEIGACLAPFNLHESVTYQPASHYWPLQWIETGMFLVLGGALAGTCFWWIRRRQN